MPRIRKKTSNRISTNERRKVTNKVRESRKKKKKAAKKNLQWKSKTPKDPGIPNNFPFKDQVLAEVSEQRRIDAEEKQRKKEEKKALRIQASRGEATTDGRDEAVEIAEGETEELTGLQIGNDAIGGIGAKRLLNVQALKPARVAYIEEDEPEDEVPVLIGRDLPTLRAVLDESDIVIEVLDARDPLPFRSLHLEELVASKQGRRMLLVLNKIDSCPRESIITWAAYLRTEHPTLLFRSATAFLPSGPDLTVQSRGRGKGKVPADDGLGVDSVLEYLSEIAGEKNDGKPLVVAVLGLTNAGKSSFINSVLKKSVFPIYSLETPPSGPSTTVVAQETMMEVGGHQIRLIDTPGLIWEADGSATSAEVRARDILLRSRGRIDRLKDPSMAISHISTQSCTEDLMLLYSLPAFTKGEPNSFLSGIARSHQLVKKRGELDLSGASRIVLRDWSTGKFPRCTTPPAKSTLCVTGNSIDTTEKLYAAEMSILATLPTRKEMWKSGGLVKLVPGKLETRKAVLDEPWHSLNQEQQNGEDCGSAVEGSIEMNDDERREGLPDGGGGVDGADVGEADESDTDAAPGKPLPIRKRVKRKGDIEHTVSRPIKKVAFALASKDRSLKHLRTVGSTAAKPAAHVTKKAKNTANATNKTRQVHSVDDGVYEFSKFF